DTIWLAVIGGGAYAGGLLRFITADFVCARLVSQLAVLLQVSGDLDGDATDGIDQLAEGHEVDQEIVVDLDAEEILRDHDLIRDAAHHERVVDLRHAVPGQLHARIPRNRERSTGVD